MRNRVLLYFKNSLIIATSVIILFFCYEFPVDNKFFYFLRDLSLFRMRENYSRLFNYFAIYLDSLFLMQFCQLFGSLFIGFVIGIFVSKYIKQLFFSISIAYVLSMAFMDFYFHRIKHVSGNFSLYVLNVFIWISQVLLFWCILSFGGFLGRFFKKKIAKNRNFNHCGKNGRSQP